MRSVFLSGVPFLRYRSARVNVVVDGNSLSAAGPDVWVTQIAGMAPLRGSGIAIRNFAISGQSWTAMNSAASDVDGSFDGSRKNVLMCFEGTNQMAGFAGAAQARSAAQTYLQGRKAAHAGWKTLVATCTPGRYGSYNDAQSAQYNADVIAYNASLRANHRAMGADYLVDLCAPGSPFRQLQDARVFTVAAFRSYGLPSYWNAAEVTTSQHVHLQNFGYTYIAALFASQLIRVTTN